MINAIFLAQKFEIVIVLTSICVVLKKIDSFQGNNIRSSVFDCRSLNLISSELDCLFYLDRLSFCGRVLLTCYASQSMGDSLAWDPKCVDLT